MLPKIREDAGLILKKYRKERGLSQTALAIKMNLHSPQHLWNIENEKNPLTIDRIELASKALGVSPNVFLYKKVKQNI
ncbi:helix-turn-helix domain-containing protein [Pediococcus acidilactici]|uniref:helix-turn-helix domain-containing protein n=1 Tax=Pediococcus acidilactici TaxID=1254 RepID=UPI00132BDB15|nr:helix-turn-helix transcriptional regulator [Pediococcus acidilactici]KAF0340619.1 helix-turn-helix domain-containing protein [Pediococcus acidilactici]KAF0380506.1 helix-turn-helix domain-containing protein [Pediococcus acidilactici]KAF0453501.1 helix-turn-helix domain-containing protein [Pediococcus acidilactici]KAF0463119.1 helix-turn-helix domain-containing protein [Pediococcus acidilactici]KAF0488154.1 helix-turn-helix domain-containing protein [Pediococcus acidilactici]